MSGGGGSQTQTTTSNPWSEAQPYLKEIMGGASDVFNFGGDMTKEYQGLNDAQREAITGARDYYSQGGGYSDYLGRLRGQANQMMDTNVANNPYVKAQMEASTRNIQNNLLQNVMPGITSGAVSTGQRGSTRQGVAEGVAAGQAAQAAADANTGILQGAYSQALQDRQRGADILGSVAEAESQAKQNIVNWENILRQDEVGAVEQDWYNQNMAPWEKLQMYSQLLYPTAGFGGTTTGVNTGRAARNPWGGAMAGAGAGMTFGPWGALAGGVLGGLSQM